MVTVTVASTDTLTRGGGGGKGRHPWTIHGWSYLVWAYADICPSKVLGNTKVTVSSMDDSGLSTAPSDNPQLELKSQLETQTLKLFYTLPVLAVYTPMYMVR